MKQSKVFEFEDGDTLRKYIPVFHFKHFLSLIRLLFNSDSDYEH